VSGDPAAARPFPLQRSGRSVCSRVASVGARLATARPRHGEAPRIEPDGQEQVLAGRDALEEVVSELLEI
jgi:hypothetical protein